MFAAMMLILLCHVCALTVLRYLEKAIEMFNTNHNKGLGPDFARLICCVRRSRFVSVRVGILVLLGMRHDMALGAER